MIAAATASSTLGRTMQLGTGNAVSVGDIVLLVGEILGKELRIELDERRVRPRSSEVGLLISNPTLARELLGWSPSIDLRHGLERTIAWIANNARLYRANDYVI